jgi:histone demethylase JARID1
MLPSNFLVAIIDVPTYYPSEEEFSDPIKYLRTVSSMAGAYGMCKIVPPENWKVT